MNEKVYTVSKLSSELKSSVEDNFKNINVKGEVQGFKTHQSGHVYFTLKDETGLIDAICWKWSYIKQSLPLEDGLEVICDGDVTTYPLRSKYQLIVKNFKIAGEGAILKMLEERKKRMLELGYFAQKRQLPYLPKRIGVITSLTGAVFHDIMNRLRARFPMHVMLCPSVVQGDGAVESIKMAIETFNDLDVLNRPDVLIIARGGGSTEDLMAFNDEAIIKAVFESKIPTISAIGHETDTTLIDYAADVRAATPTAAAEIAVPEIKQLRVILYNISERIWHFTKNSVNKYYLKLKQYNISYSSLFNLLQTKIQRLDYAVEKLENAMNNIMNNRIQRLDLAAKLLHSYSYQNTLKRGFAIVYNEKGEVIRGNNQKIHDTISVKLHNASIMAKIIKINN